MPKFLSVRDNPGLVRDPSTGAILNLAPAPGLMQRRKREAESEARLTQLESDVGDIKSMLAAILNKLG